MDADALKARPPIHVIVRAVGVAKLHLGYGLGQQHVHGAVVLVDVARAVPARLRGADRLQPARRVGAEEHRRACGLVGRRSVRVEGRAEERAIGRGAVRARQLHPVPEAIIVIVDVEHREGDVAHRRVERERGDDRVVGAVDIALVGVEFGAEHQRLCPASQPAGIVAADIGGLAKADIGEVRRVAVEADGDGARVAGRIDDRVGIGSARIEIGVRHGAPVERETVRGIARCLGRRWQRLAHARPKEERGGNAPHRHVGGNRKSSHLPEDTSREVNSQ